MPTSKAPKSSTRSGTRAGYTAQVGTKTRSQARKSAASRLNIKKAQVSRVGSHHVYKRTAMRP